MDDVIFAEAKTTPTRRLLKVAHDEVAPRAKSDVYDCLVNICIASSDSELHSNFKRVNQFKLNLGLAVAWTRLYITTEYGACLIVHCNYNNVTRRENINTTRGKDVLSNADHTQAAVSAHIRRPVTPGCDRMVRSASG